MHPGVMCERAKQRNQCFPTNTTENNLGKIVIKDIFFLCSSVNHFRSAVGHTVTKKVFQTQSCVKCTSGHQVQWHYASQLYSFIRIKNVLSQLYVQQCNILLFWKMTWSQILLIWGLMNLLYLHLFLAEWKSSGPYVERELRVWAEKNKQTHRTTKNECQMCSVCSVYQE